MAYNGFSFPDPFALAKARDDDSTKAPGLKCEVKIYEARYNSKGIRTPLQVGIERTFREQVDKDHDSALVLTRYYKKDLEQDTLEYTELEIRSHHIKKALREVIKEYPGVDLSASKVVIKDLPKCFLHYYDELNAYGLTLQDPIAVQHLVFALEYMFRVLQDQLVSYYNFMELPSHAPGLEFVNLWMVFRPGDVIYVKEENISKACRLRSMDRCSCTKKDCPTSRWMLSLHVLDFDGTRLGLRTTWVSIQPYEDYRKLEDLKAFPLRYHSNADSERAMLVARGRKFVDLAGVHYRSYAGKATTPYDFITDEDDEPPLQSLAVTSRIMIDRKAYERVYPHHSIYLWPSGLMDMENGEHLELSDDELAICHYEVPGFSFAHKRWCFFRVTNIQEIEYNLDAFGFLQLPEGQKEIIHSLVKVHKDDRLVFDDVIKGKGKGMVFLLHGTPGTGKTLTAESVADYTQRPLYAVNCGDFGFEPRDVEKNFSKIIELATSWNSILMIDEADVFLEERSTHDIKRNALVSVFLRILEYYEGIIFLTTNRVTVFDMAFRSRIHVAINYTALPASSRRDLWKSFITRGSPDSELEWMDDDYLENLAAEEWNGRQIKNTVRTAHALAVSAGRALNPQDIKTALEFMRRFDAELIDDGNEEGEDPEMFGRRLKRRRIE